jgi:uncharacterized YigZ family protein
MTYPLPAREITVELRVSNSRFIATIAPVFTVDEAKAFVTRVKETYADATHNVPAFVVGHGASVTAHCSDDGEPSGTAGRPALAVLQGSGLGDAAVVVTRYFGGTKLGTGGLVRAYGDAVRAALEAVPRAQRLPTHTVLLAVPYAFLERARLLVEAHGGHISDETFAADVTLTARFPVTRFDAFAAELHERSHGQLAAEIVATADLIVPLPNPPADE